jgi:hypothetical protein
MVLYSYFIGLKRRGDILGRIFIKDIATATRKLANLINKYEKDKISTDKMRTLVYAISKLMEGYYKFQIEHELELLKDEVSKISGNV